MARSMALGVALRATALLAGAVAAAPTAPAPAGSWTICRLVNRGRGVDLVGNNKEPRVFVGKFDEDTDTGLAPSGEGAIYRTPASCWDEVYLNDENLEWRGRFKDGLPEGYGTFYFPNGNDYLPAGYLPDYVPTVKSTGINSIRGHFIDGDLEEHGHSEWWGPESVHDIQFFEGTPEKGKLIYEGKWWYGLWGDLAAWKNVRINMPDEFWRKLIRHVNGKLIRHELWRGKRSGGSGICGPTIKGMQEWNARLQQEAQRRWRGLRGLYKHAAPALRDLHTDIHFRPGGVGAAAAGAEFAALADTEDESKEPKGDKEPARDYSNKSFLDAVNRRAADVAAARSV